MIYLLPIEMTYIDYILPCSYQLYYQEAFPSQCFPDILHNLCLQCYLYEQAPLACTSMLLSSQHIHSMVINI